MPLIVVVEQEKRYVERIEQALSPQGWEIRGVADRAAAMKQAADSEVALLVVDSEVSEAAELVSSFCRDKGGPGAVLLVPESSKGDTSGLGADEVLHKPFTDQEISLAVRRCVSAAQGGEATAATTGGEEPAGPMAMVDDGVQLTSEDIFGDVMSELEDAFSLATGDGDEPAEEAVAAEEEPEADAVEEIEVEEAGESAEVEIDAALDSLQETAEAQEAEEEAESEAEAVEPEEEVEDEAEEAAEEEAEDEVEEQAEEVDEAEEEVGEEADEVTEQEEVEVAAEEAEEEVEPVEEEPAAEEAPSKLDQALGSMRANRVAIDDEFSRPAEVTDAEIDAMVRSVIVGPSKATAPAAMESTPQASTTEQAAEVAFDESDAVPVEAFVEGDAPDEADEAPEWRSSKKWVWVVVVLLALAAVLFFVISRAQGESQTEGDRAVISEEAPAQPVEPVESNGDDE